MATANYQINMPNVTSLSCVKTDCSATVTPAMMLNTNTSSSTAKVTSNCALSCTCTGYQGAICNYNVTLSEIGDPYYPTTGLGTSNEFEVINNN